MTSLNWEFKIQFEKNNNKLNNKLIKFIEYINDNKMIETSQNY